MYGFLMENRDVVLVHFIGMPVVVSRLCNLVARRLLIMLTISHTLCNFSRLVELNDLFITEFSHPSRSS